MCDFKTEEHKMTNADVRRIAKGIVWNNTPSAIARDAVATVAIVSAVLTNDPMANFGDGQSMYWQPDMSNPYNDRHIVTEEQYRRIVAETDKQVQRVSFLLGHPTTVQ